MMSEVVFDLLKKLPFLNTMQKILQVPNTRQKLFPVPNILKCMSEKSSVANARRKNAASYKYTNKMLPIPNTWKKWYQLQINEIKCCQLQIHTPTHTKVLVPNI